MSQAGLSPQDTTSPEISVVIPVLDEKENVGPLTSELLDVLAGLDRFFEIIFIDDGSRDGTTELLRGLATDHPQVGVIVFRKNFGKASALLAGFERSRGEFVITMDGDLQDDPAEIPRLIERLEQGADLVSGWKRKRHDPLGKVIPSKLFNIATSMIGGLRLHDYNCGLKGYRRAVIENIDLYGELHRYIPVLAHRKGFQVEELAVNHRPRTHGRSKYGVSRFSKGFLDLITVFFLTRFTRRPLHLFGAIGLLFFLVGFVINTYLSVIWLQGRTIGHRPLLFLGILCVIVGIQMLTTGLLGEMMANFINRRQRDYVIREEM
jgi:glycosyltransferase involved in cell wall biosynthesis